MKTLLLMIGLIQFAFAAGYSNENGSLTYIGKFKSEILNNIAENYFRPLVLKVQDAPHLHYLDADHLQLEITEEGKRVRVADILDQLQKIRLTQRRDDDYGPSYEVRSKVTNMLKADLTYWYMKREVITTELVEYNLDEDLTEEEKKKVRQKIKELIYVLIAGISANEQIHIYRYDSRLSYTNYVQIEDDYLERGIMIQDYNTNEIFKIRYYFIQE